MGKDDWRVIRITEMSTARQIESAVNRDAHLVYGMLGNFLGETPRSQLTRRWMVREPRFMQCESPEVDIRGMVPQPEMTVQVVKSKDSTELFAEAIYRGKKKLLAELRKVGIIPQLFYTHDIEGNIRREYIILPNGRYVAVDLPVDEIGDVDYAIGLEIGYISDKIRRLKPRGKL